MRLAHNSTAIALRFAACVVFLAALYVVWLHPGHAKFLPRYVVSRRVVVAGEGAALLLGIVFGWLHARFKALADAGRIDVDVFVECRTMLRSANFYAALAASPVVFGTVILNATTTDPISGVFLALTSGFFWQRVLPDGPGRS